jgi:hypothetical protein
MADVRTGTVLCDGLEVGRIRITGGEMLSIWGNFTEAAGFSICRELLAAAHEVREKLESMEDDDADDSIDYESKLESIEADLARHRFEYRADGGAAAPVERVRWEPGWMEFSIPS